MKFWQYLISNTAWAEPSVFMPAQVTETAKHVDELYGFLVAISTISSIIIIVGMAYFAVKYKRRTNSDKTAYITHNTFLEFLWSFIPLVLFMVVFAWGWWIFHDMRTPPENAFEIHVIAKQWAWDFKYKSGKVTGKEFVVPVDTPIRLIMTSQDVIHSFYLPSLRIKQDVVPGRYTDLWFEATKMGEFHVFCAEFCGDAHSGMLGTMKVVSKADFEAFLQENDDGLTLAQKGAKLYNSKGCFACHSTDGTARVGPSWKGIWAKMEGMEDGATVKVDENYIRESILQPDAKIVKGFPKGVMPPQQGQVSDDEILAIIEYIKELK